MKSYLLMIYLISTGLYTEPHATFESCNDALIEAQLVKGEDFWGGTCVEPEDGKYVITKREEIEP